MKRKTKMDIDVRTYKIHETDYAIKKFIITNKGKIGKVYFMELGEKSNRHFDRKRLLRLNRIFGYNHLKDKELK